MWRIWGDCATIGPKADVGLAETIASAFYAFSTLTVSALSWSTAGDFRVLPLPGEIWQPLRLAGQSGLRHRLIATLPQ